MLYNFIKLIFYEYELNMHSNEQIRHRNTKGCVEVNKKIITLKIKEV